MANGKKNKEVASAEPPAGTSPEENRGPVKTFRVDDVSASVFTREHKGRTYYSVSFTRSYKDAGGSFKYTKNFDTDDLGKVVTVAQQASEYLHDLAQDVN